MISATTLGAAHFAWQFAGIVQPTPMGFAPSVMYLLLQRNL